MPRDPVTGVFTLVSNSFSDPVTDTVIDPTDADATWDDLTAGLNSVPHLGDATADSIQFNGSSSGDTTLEAAAVASGTLTLPAATDTLVGRATADNLTNKTYNKVTLTEPATSATLTLVDGTTLTGPASSGTVMTLGNTETVTGIKTFGSAGAVGRLRVAGTTSGTITLDAAAVAGTNTLTFPAETGTIITAATTKTLTNTTFDSAGSGNTLQISGVTVSRGQLPGVNSNTAATAGNIGEIVPSTVAIGSAVSLTTATPANITSISLTAGEWDVTADYNFTGNSATTVTNLVGSINTTSATLNATAGNYTVNNFASFTAFSANNTFILKGGPVRLSLSGTTTVYAVAQATFAVNTCSVYGQIRATRVH